VSVEFWTHLSEDVRDVARLASECEEQGWTGITFPDTQFLFADAYVMMTAASLATSTLQIAQAATNCVTRHPSITAAAITAVHQLSGGRATLGISRGDSSLFFIGRPPVGLADFVESVGQLRALLHGESVIVPAVDSELVQVGEAPASAELRWRDPSLSPPRINVYTSGPKTIGRVAAVTDRITLAVGASLERLSWGVDLATNAFGEATLHDPDITHSLGVGAVITIAPHRDLETSRKLIAGSVATVARFSAMSGAASAGAGGEHSDAAEQVARSYDMRKHGQGASAQAAVLSDEFIDRFAITGSPDTCIERLEALMHAGLSHLSLVPPGPDRAGSDRDDSIRLLNTEVLPAMRTLSAAISGRP
jgi:5,10-methylenetetrahydromethanopterin reductase